MAKDRGWDSGLIKKDGEWRMVVEKGASEAYFCRFHLSMIARLDIGSSPIARVLDRPATGNGRIVIKIHNASNVGALPTTG